MSYQLDFSTTGVLKRLGDGSFDLHLGSISTFANSVITVNAVLVTNAVVVTEVGSGVQHTYDIRFCSSPTYATPQELLEELETAIAAMYAGGGGGGGTVDTVGWTNQYGMSATVDASTPSAPVIEPVGTESIVKTIVQAAHNLTLGQAVRLNGGLYVPAQGDTAANAACVGFVLEVVGAGNNQFRLLTAGHSAGAPAAMFSGLTAGTAAYLDPTTAGALTNTPNAFGPVLMPTSTTAGYVLSNADSVALFTSPANTRANLGLPNVYTGILNQAGTDAPVATFETNQLGSVNFTYIDVGEYRLNGTGLFPAGTKVFIGNSVTAIVLASRDTDNRVVIYSQDHAGSPADDLLINASIRVEVWP